MSSLISSLQKSLHGTYIYIVNVWFFFLNSCKPIKPLKPSGKTVYFPFSHNSAGRVRYGYRSSGEVWHQDIGSGSFGSCGLQVKPRWINLLPAHPTDTWQCVDESASTVGAHSNNLLVGGQKQKCHKPVCPNITLCCNQMISIIQCRGLCIILQWLAISLRFKRA